MIERQEDLLTWPDPAPSPREEPTEPWAKIAEHEKAEEAVEWEEWEKWR
jgi:hypothetical protein